MKKLLGKAKSFADRAQTSQGFSRSAESRQDNSRPLAVSNLDQYRNDEPHTATYPYINHGSEQNQVSPKFHRPTQLDVLRYRYHHGANLGGIFVLEKWLYGDMFDSVERGESELDAVTTSIKKYGVDISRMKWEYHWQRALSNYELAFLAVYCTSIRLPIGYYTLGHFFTVNTPFEGPPSEVYVNAWAAVKELCGRLHKAGIGTLIDLHALPGGANGQAHSGTSSGKAGLWGHQQNLNTTTRCLEFLASEIAAGNVAGCIGLQVCNEAVYGAAGIYDWYSDVLQKVSRIDNSIPLYISDAWDLGKAISWVTGQNKASNSTCPVIVDTHRYYTFSAADRSQSPQTIISRIPSELSEADVAPVYTVDGSAVDVVVGEWSCVLDGESWAKAGDTPREQLVREFGMAQCQQWSKRARGSFFWTAKMNWMDGGEWGFFEMTKKGAIASPPGHLLHLSDTMIRLEKADRELETLRARAVAGHQNYWVQACPGQYFEHWRFEAGWDLGYMDSGVFFRMRTNGQIAAKMGGDSIGLLGSWMRMRLRESGMTGEFVWEWEHGFRQGVMAFSAVISA